MTATFVITVSNRCQIPMPCNRLTLTAFGFDTPNTWQNSVKMHSSVKKIPQEGDLIQLELSTNQIVHDGTWSTVEM